MKEENQWPNEGGGANQKHKKETERLLIKPKLPQTPTHLLPRTNRWGERRRDRKKLLTC